MFSKNSPQAEMLKFQLVQKQQPENHFLSHLMLKSLPLSFYQTQHHLVKAGSSENLVSYFELSPKKPTFEKVLNRTEVFQQTFLHLGFLAQKHIRATVHFLFYSISKPILAQKSLRRPIVLSLNRTAFQIQENAPTQLLARVKLVFLFEQQLPVKFQAEFS